MKKTALIILSSLVGVSAFAQSSEIVLKVGQSVVVCRADNTDTKNQKDGLSDLNRLLIQDEIKINVKEAYGYNYNTVVVKSPFNVSSPTISTTKNKQSSLREYDDTYTYCVTLTKQ